MKIKIIFMAATVFSLAACTNPEKTTPTTPAGSNVNPPKTPPEYGSTPAQDADTAINNARNPNEMPPAK